VTALSCGMAFFALIVMPVTHGYDACLAGGAATYPDYKVFNYVEREPVQSIPTSPHFVYLHGSVEKMSDGFVFDNVSYADNTVKQNDWLRKSALHISHGNCLFVGSKFKESDIEACIRQRETWDSQLNGNTKNWIVLRSFTALELQAYNKRGIIPIKAEAKDFFSYLFAKVSLQTPEVFIKRKAPYLSGKNTEPIAWFVKNFESVLEQLNKAKERQGIHSKFYFGDMPDWFYISKGVPAELSIIHDIESEILKFERGTDKARLIPIIGALGSGKTTAAMMAIGAIAKTHNNVYRLSGLDGIDVEYLWSVVKETKGLMTLFIDSSSSFFFAINKLINYSLTKMHSCKLCIVIEERSAHFHRNKRHLHQVPSNHISIIGTKNLDNENAKVLLKKTDALGIKFERLEGLSQTKSIDTLVSLEKGYSGDLLAALYNLSSQKSYKEQLSEEYTEIISDIGRAVFQTISLVTASRLAIPINYLAECHSLTINRLMGIINHDLQDKVRVNENQLSVSARHHSIAEFHLKNNFDNEPLKERIIDLMLCLSSKFKIEDIKKQPVSYRIYRNIMSFHYLTEVLFAGKENYPIVFAIYSTCQEYYSEHAIFWLQFGRFLERDNDIEGALHCFRRGLVLYDSFQLRHATGQLLLKKYTMDESKDRDCYDEGVRLLRGEISSRGSTDPYPYTALADGLLKVLAVYKNDAESIELLRDVFNSGMKIHKDDPIFSAVSKRVVCELTKN